MFKQITNLAGGEYYLIASLLIFFIFFLFIAYHIFSLSKEHIAIMSELPIADQEKSTNSHESPIE